MYVHRHVYMCCQGNRVTPRPAGWTIELARLLQHACMISVKVATVLKLQVITSKLVHIHLGNAIHTISAMT